MQTLGGRLTYTGGRPSGFDYQRILLAVAVVTWHSVYVTGGRELQQFVGLGPARPIVAAILPMFFALSGFLVAGSLARSASMLQFFGLRALRIFPALFAEVLLSAMILGPLVTTMTLSGYFGDAEFWRYLLNVTGNIHYDLPGVFKNNPVPGVVNGQLWTIPYELECYIAIGIISVLGVVRRARLFGLVVLALMTLQWSLALYSEPQYSVAVSGRVLVLAFLFGVSIFQLRDVVPWHPLLFWMSVAMATAFFYLPHSDAFAAPFIAYISAYLGLCNPRANSLNKLGDLSYGIFLYGWPIQQTAMWMGVTGFWSNLSLSLLLATAFAYLSWNLVEKPALGLKKHLPQHGPERSQTRSSAAADQLRAAP
ncbi:acyltransferase [Sphingomonas swuensis]|uniref:Acyltransferase n=1 Tax=Sphingomonas swuensis TaxID=977800 RepID=A0ABP7T2S5_9SPHN